MNTLNSSQIDEAILSVSPTSWGKVARVIVMAGEILGDSLPKGEAGLDLVADRVEALIHDGRLLAQGDIKKWRHSEVRKPISS
jgi:hypothetical protein